MSTAAFNYSTSTRQASLSPSRALFATMAFCKQKPPSGSVDRET